MNIADSVTREMLGFVVLSLAVLVPVLIVTLGGIAAWLVARRMKTTRTKWGGGLIAALIVILVPTWDEMVGRLYFKYLCATEGQVKVYQRVELPEEYWNADGTPTFIKPNGDVEKEMLGHQFEFITRPREVSGAFRIQSLDFIVIDKSSQNRLGEYSSLGFFGGWLRNSTALHVTGTRCPNRPRAYTEAILMAAVKRAASKDQSR